MIFKASNGPHGVEVWRTDGTAAGTTMIADVAPGLGSSNPFNFTLIGEKLFFMADDGSTGVELHMRHVDLPLQTETPTVGTPTVVSTSTPPLQPTAEPSTELRYHVYIVGIVR